MPIKAIVSGVENAIKRIPMKGQNLLSEKYENRSINGVGAFTIDSNYDLWLGEVIPGQTYTISNMDAVYGFFTAKPAPNAGVTYNGTRGYELSGTAVVTIPSGCTWIAVRVLHNADNAMLNLGSTAMPYEPYGYQEGWEVRDNQNRLIWGREETLTGTGSISFKGAGIPLKSVDIFGNTQQTGTPTPDAPIMPQFVGVRTANLFDKNSDTINNNGQVRPGVKVSSGAYSINNTTDRAVYYRIGNEGTSVQVNAGRKAENILANDDLYVWRDNNVRTDGIMLNLGSTALPYEPFGWAEKITCAGQTVPVYLGQTPTVRRVMKLVLTGEENWNLFARTYRFFYIPLNPKCAGTTSSYFLCTHRTGLQSPSTRDSLRWYDNNTDWSDVDSFKAWLAAQYANGTPVTVWYVLSEPETAIVNEPLAKIGDYADELSSTIPIPTVKGANVLTVDTTLPPSSMSITGHITSAS